MLESIFSRFEFVSHLVQFGLFLPVAKLQAIILNDTSGTFVHPCLVHIANLMGCHLHQDNRLDYSLNHLELLHLNTVCQSLEEMDRYSQTQPRFHVPGQSYPSEEYDGPMKGEAEDPFTYVQIRFLLFLYTLLWRCTGVSSRLLRSVFYLAERNELRFVPEHRLAQLQRERQCHAGFAGDGSPVAEFSESDYERASLMTSLLGADAGLQLFGLERRPELSWLDLERQFFDEFPVRSFAPLQFRGGDILWIRPRIPPCHRCLSYGVIGDCCSSTTRRVYKISTSLEVCFFFFTHFRSTTLTVINYRGCGPVVRRLNQLALRHGRGSPGRHSFARR